jgi:hypothetical protein
LWLATRSAEPGPPVFGTKLSELTLSQISQGAAM